ncbi:hypothetical protein [Caballeronia sp. KNU42]
MKKITEKGRAMTDTTPEKVAHTIKEFCALYHIGRTHYYALQASGEGSVELRAGPRKVLITRRRAKAWERRFEKQPVNGDSVSDAA